MAKIRAVRYESRVAWAAGELARWHGCGCSQLKAVDDHVCLNPLPSPPALCQTALRHPPWACRFRVH
ncbi:MAG: hypothetical protein M3R24_17860, partial [Chloroflexota bacterium]|nr:hypothetical protein [Chloroflexota bacterium]